ncbi:MAG: hypothetical protein M4579_006729 [Chaenotheca gracillima]|nr:MAG: hypothetical protein M4579_006729 [Chaenotheca gracillima]
MSLTCPKQETYYSKMVGKRKREGPPASGNTVSEDQSSPNPATEDASDIFRKYFEAQFKPLELQPQPLEHADQDDGSLPDSDQNSEWSGFSEDEDVKNVEIIDYSVSSTREEDREKSKEELKAFMVLLPFCECGTPLLTNLLQTSKPPSQGSQKGITKKKAEPSDPEDATDAANLKKDLALQRLLQESHLLENNDSLTPTGTKRHKALDLRQQALGSKATIYKQEKMPMSHRKGITAKATQREEQRRREAKENGIVLEKPKKEKKSLERRERGVGGPTVGKFRGGTLKLSSKDVAEIQGPKPFKKGKSRKR